MTKADPLIAAFRQLATGKATSRLGSPGGTIAKENSDKAAHFREQLRSVAKGANPESKAELPKGELPKGEFAKTEVPKDEIRAAKQDLLRGLEPSDHVAEVADEVTSQNGRADQRNEVSPPQVAVDATPSPPNWRGPEATLSAVISRLDQAQSSSARDDAVTPPMALPESRAEPRETAPNLDDPVNAPKADDQPEQRFTLTVDAAETRTAPTLKVVVRDQETHFEPVQQLTLLQKIVDRMVTDLPAVSPQADASSAADAASPTSQVADKPVRILTLELDPPNLGAVTVKMRLIGNAVEVHLSADRHETTQMLRQERGALTEVMQSAGYAIDIAAIDHSRAGDANPGAGQQQAQSDHRPSQPLPDGSQTNSANSERQSGDAQAGTRQHRQQHDQFKQPAERPQDQEVVRNRNGGGTVYL